MYNPAKLWSGTTRPEHTKCKEPFVLPLVKAANGSIQNLEVRLKCK